MCLTGKFEFHLALLSLNKRDEGKGLINIYLQIILFKLI